MKYLFNLLLAPFRFHDFDLDNVIVMNTGPIDKDVTNEPRVLLYFVALCKHCGQPIQVSRSTYIDPESITRWDKWICIRHKAVFEHWKEQVTERKAELRAMNPTDYALDNETRFVPTKQDSKPDERELSIYKVKTTSQFKTKWAENSDE